MLSSSSVQENNICKLKKDIFNYIHWRSQQSHPPLEQIQKELFAFDKEIILKIAEETRTACLANSSNTSYSPLLFPGTIIGGTTYYFSSSFLLAAISGGVSMGLLFCCLYGPRVIAKAFESDNKACRYDDIFKGHRSNPTLYSTNNIKEDLITAWRQPRSKIKLEGNKVTAIFSEISNQHTVVARR